MATAKKDRALLTRVCPKCNREWTSRLMITEKELEQIRKNDPTLFHFMGRMRCRDCCPVDKKNV